MNETAGDQVARLQAELAEEREARSALVELSIRLNSLLNLPEGCSFGPRCSQRFEACAQRPPLEGAGEHLAACWIPPEEREEARYRAAHPDSALRRAGK